MPDSFDTRSLQYPTPLNDEYYRQVMLVARTLRDRDFTDKHFDTANRFIEGLKSAPGGFVERDGVTDELAPVKIGQRLASVPEKLTAAQRGQALATIEQARGVLGQPEPAHGESQAVVGQAQASLGQAGVLKIDRTAHARTLSHEVVVHQQRGRYHQPCIMSLMMTHNPALQKSIFCYGEVWLPLFIDWETARNDQLVKTGKKFDPEELLSLSIMSLAFARAFEKMPELQHRLMSPDGVPFLLPGKGGLFGCHARLRRPGEMDENVGISRERANGQFKVNSFAPFWSPNVQIFVGAFFGGKVMKSFSGLSAVDWEFKKLMAEEDFDGAVAALFMKFSNPVTQLYFSRNNLGKIKEATVAIEDKDMGTTTTKIKKEDVASLLDSIDQCDELLPYLEARLPVFLNQHALRWAAQNYSGHKMELRVPPWNRRSLKIVHDAQLADQAEVDRRAALKQQVVRTPVAASTVVGLPGLFPGISAAPDTRDPLDRILEDIQKKSGIGAVADSFGIGDRQNFLGAKTPLPVKKPGR